MEGVVGAKVKFATETVSVNFYENVAKVSDIIEEVKRLGYVAEDKTDRTEADENKELKKMQRHLIIYVILYLPLLMTMLVNLIGFTLPAFFNITLIQLALPNTIYF